MSNNAKETIAFKIEKDKLEDIYDIFQIDGKSQSERMRNLCYALLKRHKTIVLRDSEVERLNRIIEGNKSKMESIEQLIRENEKLKRDLESLKNELLEIRDNNDALKKDTSKKAYELKFIKDNIEKDINGMLMMESALDIKLTLRKMKDDIRKKIDYELQKSLYQ